MLVRDGRYNISYMPVGIYLELRKINKIRKVIKKKYM